MKIEIIIDTDKKTVQFRGMVSVPDAEIIVQSLMDGYGWSRQDMTFGIVAGGPTVEPGAPMPIPGSPTDIPQVARFHCHGDPILCNNGTTTSTEPPYWASNPMA